MFCRPGQAVGTSLLLPFWLYNSVTRPHPTAQQIILLTPWGKKKESGDFGEQLCVSATKAHTESLHLSTPSSLKHPGTLTPLAPASLSDPVESPATNPLTHPAPRYTGHFLLTEQEASFPPCGHWVTLLLQESPPIPPHDVSLTAIPRHSIASAWFSFSTCFNVL